LLEEVGHHGLAALAALLLDLFDEGLDVCFGVVGGWGFWGVLGGGEAVELLGLQHFEILYATLFWEEN
jgi:hypothetical protein